MNVPSARIKSLLLLLGLLLLSNLVLLYFLLNRPQPRDRNAMMRNALQEVVGFNAAQLKSYDSLAKANMENMRPKFDSMRIARQQRLKALAAAGYSDSAITALAENTSGQVAMEKNMMWHYRQVRQLCTPAQVPLFDSILPTLLAPPKDKRK